MALEMRRKRAGARGKIQCETAHDDHEANIILIRDAAWTMHVQRRRLGIGGGGGEAVGGAKGVNVDEGNGEGHGTNTGAGQNR
jgi:hypothetical protein